MSEKIYDSIRKQWVAATPEELVRQRLIFLLTEELGFPRELMAVERRISEITFDSQAPNRRLDLLCYYREKEALKPLLIIECKAIPLSSAALQQVIGYNDYVRAPYISIVNGDKIKLGWYDATKKNYCFVDGIPDYRELIQACASL